MPGRPLHLPQLEGSVSSFRKRGPCESRGDSVPAPSIFAFGINPSAYVIRDYGGISLLLLLILLSVFTTQLLNPLRRTNTYLNIYYYPRLWSYTSWSSHFHLLRDPRNRWVSHPDLKAGTQGSASLPRGPVRPRERRVVSLLLRVSPRPAGVPCS